VSAWLCLLKFEHKALFLFRQVFPQQNRGNLANGHGVLIRQRR